MPNESITDYQLEGGMITKLESEEKIYKILCKVVLFIIVWSTNQ